MSKASRKEITNKIVLNSKNKFVLKALCDELQRYEFKFNPLMLCENESLIKIDLENKTLSLSEIVEPAHFESPKDYLILLKKIDSVCRNYPAK